MIEPEREIAGGDAQTAQPERADNPAVAALTNPSRAPNPPEGALGETEAALSPPEAASSGPEAALSQRRSVKRESARRTRRSFVTGAVAAAAGYGMLHWIDTSAPEGRLQSALRRTLQTNAAINRAVFEERGLAPSYPLSRARPLRLNGVIGLGKVLEPGSWRLQMAGVANPESSPRYSRDITAWDYQYASQAPSSQPGEDLKIAPRRSQPSLDQRFDREARPSTHKRRQGTAEAGASASSLDIGTPGLLLTMDDLLSLPRVELVTQFKCIEGWSEITHWGGVRLRDLIEAYPPARIVENGKARDPRYLYMETPDGDFYCGYDMAAARHPQSLLVTEMSGQPLNQLQGAPLRLHMPIKYGYKQIKRIGLIAYTDSKPDDYWTKLGYDWYAGL